jgi:hypothetical protein
VPEALVGEIEPKTSESDLFRALHARALSRRDVA